MGVFDKFKELVGFEEVDDDDFLEEEEKTSPKKVDRIPIEPKMNYAPRQGSNKEKVVSIHSKATNPFKLMVVEPEGFEECPKLVDSLKARKPVIINLEKIDVDSARKIFDFLSGATYALSGTVQPVANNIFIFAPENVDITASISGGGFEFGNMDKEPWR
ncbi:MAG: cell division protein SepF [Anaerovoracaceae bacterium]